MDWRYTITIASRRAVKTRRMEGDTTVECEQKRNRTNGDQIRNSENAVLASMLAGFCPYHGSGEMQCVKFSHCTECRADWLDRRADGD